MTDRPPFWQPAVQRAQIWRTALGLVLIVLVYAAVAMAILYGGTRILGTGPGAALNGKKPEFAALFFLTFAGFHLGLMVVIPVLHKRSYLSLLGPQNRLSWPHFRRGIAVIGAVLLVMSLLLLPEQWFLPDAMRPRITMAPVSRWLVWLLPALFLVFVQIMAEEMLFRGYLLQQLRARFRSVWIWAVLPSLVFGALHFDPATYGNNAYLYVLNTTVMGVIACLVTIRTGNLGAAAGLHFGNNAYMTLLGIEGDLDGFSLLSTSLDLRGGYAAYSMLLQTALIIIAFALWWRWMIRKRPIAKAVVSD